MNHIHRRALQINHSFLLRELDPDELASSLYSREVMTTVQYEKIESRIGVRERNLQLLQILPRRGPNAFPELITALKETRQSHVMDELVKCVDAIKRERDESLIPSGDDRDRNDTVMSETPPPTTATPTGPVRPESRNRKKSFRPYYEINSHQANPNRPELEQRNNNQMEDGTNRTPMIRTPIGSAEQSVEQPMHDSSNELELIPSTELFYKETYAEISMEKIIICGLPGVDTERVHDLLRAHDFNIAAEGKIIEHFSSEWVDCVDDFRKGSRGSLKIHLEGMMKLYDDHNIRVISDIPALVLLRELVAHCSDCKVIFVQHQNQVKWTEQFKAQFKTMLNWKTWFDWLIINCGLKGPEYRHYYWNLYHFYLKFIFATNEPRRLWTHPLASLQQLSDTVLTNKYSSINDIILIFGLTSLLIRTH